MNLKFVAQDLWVTKGCVSRVRSWGIFGSSLFSIGALAAGTIPAVSGYSNSQHRLREFTTVGIVIQISKFSGKAFKVQKLGGVEKTTPLKVGEGLLKGEKLWLETGSVVHFSDIDGSRFVAAGPSVIEVEKEIRLMKGALYVASPTSKLASSKSVSKTSPQNAFAKVTFSAGFAKVDTRRGRVAVWVSPTIQKVQAVALSGEVYFSHWQLPSGRVQILPAYYSELNANAKYLQPENPKKMDPENFEKFVARFDQNVEFPETSESPELDQTKNSRQLASTKIPLESIRGSRTASDIHESKDQEAMQILFMKMRGQDFEEKFPEKSLNKVRSKH